MRSKLARSTRISFEVREENRIRGWQRHLKTGVMDVLVLAQPGMPNYDRAYQAVEIINSLQAFFRLRLTPDVGGKLLTFRRSRGSDDRVRDRIQKRYPTSLVIALTDDDLEDDYIIAEEPGCTLISAAEWEDVVDAVPAMRVYLVYLMTTALVSFAGCLTGFENESLMHGRANARDDEPGNRGCLFDYCEDEYNRQLGMVCARLCATCQAMLVEHGMPPAALAAIEKLLDWVRSAVLGRERPLPRKIFIGHGRHKDWKVLRSMLQGWNLEVEEFNEEPVAGISVSLRLKTMLEQSRFAFLIMTPEDEIADDSKDAGKRYQSRMNVVHEIGLFQGRLGSESAVVIRDRKTETFSNMDGINRIDYDSGKLASLEDELFELLVRRGILHADAARPNRRG